jgi:thiamine biosynthesis protein ThiS
LSCRSWPAKIEGEMKLQINGEPRDFTTPLSLSSLVEQLGMKQDRVAVELNRNLIPREQWGTTDLAEGDRLEIVHFVGGGRA